MRTVHWQLSFEGLVLSQESHAWDADLHFTQHEDHFNFQQAGTRRPVRARLSQPICGEERLGRVVLVPAGFSMPVQTVGVEVDFPVRKFEFDLAWLNAKLPETLDFDFRKAYALPVFDEPTITAVLDRIHDELTMMRKDSKLLLESLVHVLAIYTARSLIARSKQMDHSPRRFSPEQTLRIRHLIQTTEFKDLTLAYLAEQFEMRQPRLREMFKNTTGRSLRTEIEEARVNAACQQLLEAHLPLKVLAHNLGFTHASAFCHWFKLSTGVTPTEYRNSTAVVRFGTC